MSFKLITDLEKIDLTRHALIEASAGTGKTYTIEHLVARLIAERKDLTIENILMVTFTEKGTGDLKIRIRNILEKKAGAPDIDMELKKKYRQNVNVFDTASIYTIHGFCHTVLNDFAFENAGLFEHELVDDLPVYETLLREQMRKDWREKYGTSLPGLLVAAGFENNSEAFIRLIIDIAVRRYRENAGDRLVPEPDNRDISLIVADLKTILLKMKVAFFSPFQFSQGFEQLHINKKSRTLVLNQIVIPLEMYLESMDETHFDLGSMWHLMRDINTVSSTGRKGINCLIPEKWLKAGDNSHACPNIQTVVDLYKKADTLIKSLRSMFIINTVRQLRRDASQTKKRHGWISYDDMLSQVEQSLYGSHGPALIYRLRKQYHIAFVDEFQDTDPIQWRIFKRIFIDEMPGNNVLFVIGDPKQAIYSFRGADVYTYLSAKETMETLEKKKMANLYSLQTNYRSQPDMVNGFNRLFCRDQWFHPEAEAKAFEIGYQQIYSPDAHLLPGTIVSDGSGRSAINLVDISESPSPTAARYDLAAFIGDEILRLVRHPGIVVKVREKETPSKASSDKPLDLGDICILVCRRSEVPPIEAALTQREIPYAYYKKPGLFSSDEAGFLRLIFHAIVDAEDFSAVKKALLTPFFGFRINDLYLWEDLPMMHPARQLLHAWTYYAESGQWSRLFQSLMEDSGLIYRQSENPQWDRIQTNYNQMFEILETQAIQKNLDFRGLTALLDGYGKGDRQHEEDSDIHQIESDAKKVRIMTMHVSKGLEFPVVFIAGGLTRPTSADYHVYHHTSRPGTDNDKNNKIKNTVYKVIDLEKENREAHQQEIEDEEKRLFYVALTRAEYKLYVPYFSVSGNQGWIGPVCRFVYSSIDQAFQTSALPEYVSWIHPATAPAEPSVPDICALQTDTNDRSTIPEKTVFPFPSNFCHRKPAMASYSSIVGHPIRSDNPDAGSVGFRPLEAAPKEPDETTVIPVPRASETQDSQQDVFGGPQVGSMFHDILEQVDFQAIVEHSENIFNNPEISDLIDHQMFVYGIDPRWRQYIGQIISNTLNTPIFEGNDHFILGQLKPGDRRHEVEFLYPVRFHGTDPHTDTSGLQDRTHPEKYIRGFIDLIFRFDHRYYIADWKSNYLENGYDQKTIKESMDHADYHLQYQIYAVAFLKRLAMMYPKKNVEQMFGGIFYFYIRGMGTGGQNGIFFVPSDQIGDLKLLERKLAYHPGLLE